jgi:hypothetical protein
MRYRFWDENGYKMDGKWMKSKIHCIHESTIYGDFNA